MVETLPRNIQLKLDQTLAQWHSWRRDPTLTQIPKTRRLLSPGLSNYSILVEADRQYVVRIDGLNPAVIGLSRQTEWRALQSASAAGLAPQPRYYNPELGSLVKQTGSRPPIRPPQQNSCEISTNCQLSIFASTYPSA